jgi:putative spermidine/putrescine transport system permease protein
MKPSLSAATLLGPASALVTLGVLVPLVLMARYSLNAFRPEEFMVEAVTLENYRRFFVEPFWHGVLANTVWVSALSTGLALLLALPLGYQLARMQSRWKSALILLTVVPLFIGNAVRAAGWMAVLGHGGVVEKTGEALGLTSGPLNLMFSSFAVVIGTVSVVLPYLVLAVQAGIEGVGTDLEQAARSLGASPFVAFLRVVLPLAMPSILAGAALVFILCVNAFATPVLLGGPQFQMMGPAIYDQITGQSNWPFGSALAFILVAATLLALAAIQAVGGRTSKVSA